jgi:NDP-sugar pyrophosphorylase family protein
VKQAESSIASGVKIEGCHIENSIIYEQANIKGISLKIKNSIIGRHVFIEGLPAEGIDNVEYILGDKSVLSYSSKQEEDD